MHVHHLADREHTAHRHLRARLVFGGHFSGNTELLEDLAGFHTRLGEVARFGLGNARSLALAECDLDGAVAVGLFTVGQVVDVQGTSIGKGFTGTIKRHNFSSQRASHGNSRSHNVPGSISMAQDPGRVFPGKKMSGQRGDVTKTTQNLDVVRVDEARQLLLVRGAVPGAKNGHVVVRPAVKAPPKGAVKKGAN